jgi:hypothetical protein
MLIQSLAASVVLFAASAAGERVATPDTLTAVLSAARPGDTIRLAPDQFPPMHIKGLRFSPAVTLDARGATVTELDLRDVTGLHVLGGTWKAHSNETPKGVAWGAAVRCQFCHDISFDGATFSGPKDDGYDAAGYGLSTLDSDHVSVTHSTFRGFRMGVGFGRTGDFVATDNDFGYMSSDGIDIGQGWRGRIENNIFHDTHIINGEHPDGVQMWSRPDTPPTSDITIRHNKVYGSTQGISAFDGAHPQPPGYKLADGRVLTEQERIPDGGFERIVIEDNEVKIDAPDGISLINGRDSVIRHNHIVTLPTARYIAKFYIKPDDGGTAHCGNVAEPGAGKRGWDDGGCPRTKK